MLKIIKRVNQFQLAKTLAVCYGLPVALVFILVMFIKGFMSPAVLLAGLLMGLLYPVIMFISIWTLGWFYNFCLPWTGGIEVELEDQ